MDKGKRNIIIVIVILALFEIFNTVTAVIVSKNPGEFNIFAFLIYCLIFQSLYEGKKWARYLVLVYSYWAVLQSIWLVWLPSIISRKLVQPFGILSSIGVIFLWIALLLTFNKNIKQYFNKQS